MSNQPIPKSLRITVLGMIVVIGFTSGLVGIIKCPATREPAAHSVGSQEFCKGEEEGDTVRESKVVYERSDKEWARKEFHKMLHIYTDKGAFVVQLPGLSLESQFSRISQRDDDEDYDDVIIRLEAFAKEHPKHDLAAEAHLKIVDILAQRKKNIDGAIEKLKWVAVNFPKAKKKQYILLGWCPLTMWEEWKDYVEKHPILIKDYAWYKLAELYKRAKRYDNTLAAYDHVLATVNPDKLPDTKNTAIVITFRLHKNAFESKILLLRSMRRMALVEKKTVQVQKLAAEIKKATVEYEKLYPKVAWKKLGLKADAAFQAYIEESGKLQKLKGQEELRRMEEEEKRYKQEPPKKRWLRDRVEYEHKKIARLLREYKEKHGYYPKQLKGLDKALPKDIYSPKKEEHRYQLISGGYILSSCGEDGIYGNADDVLYIACLGYEIVHKRHELKPLQPETSPSAIKEVKINRKDGAYVER